MYKVAHYELYFFLDQHKQNPMCACISVALTVRVH